MHLRDLIHPDCVVYGLRAFDKDQALHALAQQAASCAAVSEDLIYSALADRERLGSTGLGRGFALPHARILGLEDFYGMFVRLRRGVDFQAIDGAPVDLIFALLIPQTCGDHVSALAMIARELRDASRLERLRAAKSVKDLYEGLVRNPGDEIRR